MILAGNGFAGIIFMLVLIGVCVFVFYSANKKMKNIKEKSRQRELDFFAQNAAAFVSKAQADNATDRVYSAEKLVDEGERAALKMPVKEGQEEYNRLIDGKEEIVVLDGQVLNPGDLSWDGFKKFGKVTVYDRTPQELVLERMQEATLVITNKAVISREIINQCPKLRYIGVIATGYNVVDVEAARENNVTVTNVPGYGTDAVAQFTFALMLELCNQVGLHSRSVMEGGWCSHPDFSYWLSPLADISGKTLGIVGYGSIGSRVAEIALAFGMKVLVFSRTKRKSDDRIKWVSLDELLTDSDIVTLHCPLTKDNYKMINKQSIDKMKDGAKLINTARGGLVDEAALVQALNSGKLSGAALDVVSEEPMVADNPLLLAKNIVITPHIAWASNEARGRLMNIAVRNMEQFLLGNVENKVN